MAGGYGIDRRDVMYNDFVIVGPRFDPAGIRGLKDAARAFAQIAAKGVLFASRGDSGGTYRMELRLWKLAGVEPAGQAWYRDVDRGIGATLNFASALNTYALTDRATWANFKNRQNLEILTEGDPALFNLYGSILVNPARWPDVKYNEARHGTAGLHRGPVSMRSRHTASTARNFSFRRVHDCDISAPLDDIIRVLKVGGRSLKQRNDHACEAGQRPLLARLHFSGSHYSGCHR